MAVSESEVWATLSWAQMAFLLVKSFRILVEPRCGGLCVAQDQLISSHVVQASRRIVGL